MNPTSGERREVAARLRKRGGLSVAELKVDLWERFLGRLADLIDRPTCHICETDHEFEDSVRCDRCRMTFMRPWEPFKYCPECGARVVTDDE